MTSYLPDGVVDKQEHYQISSDWVPPTPLQWWSQFNLSFMILFQTWVRLYHPPSLLSEGFKVQMYIASFTPLSNHMCSTDSILISVPQPCVCVLRPLMWWNSVSYVLQIVFSVSTRFHQRNICGFTFFTANFIH